MEVNQELAISLGVKDSDDNHAEDTNTDDEEKEDEGHRVIHKLESSKDTEKKDGYRDYTDAQIDKYIDLLQEGISVQDAATSSGITLGSAYRYKTVWEKYGASLRRQKRGPKVGTVSPLKEEHSQFIIAYVDNYAAAILQQIRDDLCNAFLGLKISISAIQRHMKTNCALTLKSLEKLPAKRNSEEIAMQRKACVQEWLADKDMDFEKNCVFLDEAGFNLHITRNIGWSKKGKPAKADVPTNRGTSITILGAISSEGIIDISLRKSTSSAAAKKRKVDGKAIVVSIGTRTDHYLSYLSNVMNVLDKNGLQCYYLVMDDAPIHKPSRVRELIEGRGYKCVYLPPYSPFLNPIEEFWSKVKSRIKRSPIDGKDTLTPRIVASCSNVTQKDCQGWLKVSSQKFSNPFQKLWKTQYDIIGGGNY